MASLCFDSIFAKYQWREIPNCPGRFVTRKPSAFIEKLVPSEVKLLFAPRKLFQVVQLDGSEDMWKIEVYEFDLSEVSPTSSVRDPICVVVFPPLPGTEGTSGGLITYKKPDRFVHTLNTPSGLKRKLDAIGLNADQIIAEALQSSVNKM